MSRNGSIKYQIQETLKSKCRFGESRDEAKKADKAKMYIYSINTLKTYMKQLNYFVKWAKGQNIKIKNIDDIRTHSDEWLQDCVNKGMSPWTVTTRRSALCKLLGVDYSYFKTKIPPRERRNIKRSRSMLPSLERFSEANNKEQVTFCKCTGLRYAELCALKGNALFFNKDGRAGLHVTEKTKGGRPRNTLFYGTQEEIELCVSLCKKANDKRVFEHIKKAANTHGYRSDYCKKVYKEVARDVNLIPSKDKVFCRKDKAGIVYDKKALYACSEMLGHSRYDVCNQSYLR